MAKITKLPSGSYHAQVYAGKDEKGKRKYKSFTGETREEVRRAVATWELDKKRESKPSTMTLGQAVHKYTLTNKLSPTTLRTYLSAEQYYKTIENVLVDNITDTTIQSLADELTKRLAVKTVKNIISQLKTAIRAQRPNLRINVKYERKIKNVKLRIPTESEMEAVFRAAYGKKVEVPILLGACYGLRRSEIVGLTWNNINLTNKTIFVESAIVKDKDNNPVRKPPKTDSGYRTMAIKQNRLFEILESVPEKERTGAITTMSGDAIYDAFQRILNKLGIPPCRFHDLRHFFASVMCALNIPAKYAAQLMGHADETMLKRVYEQIIAEQSNVNTEKVREYFDKMQNKMQNAI